jgi:hypothetical protein
LKQNFLLFFFAFACAFRRFITDSESSSSDEMLGMTDDFGVQ